MSDSEDASGGRREVAYRIFAAEFDDADLSYSESDEERAPNYVVTPTGARVNRLFVVGVLTEVERVSDDVLRARVVDPTGAFVLYAGQYQPDERAFLDGAETPMFVAVTGKARTFQPEDSDRVFTSVRPESISQVDAATRDRWTVQTAEQTLDRVRQAATALSLGSDGDRLADRLRERDLPEGLAAGIPLALDHYGTTPAYLDGLRDLALDAARVVAGERDEVGPFERSPDEAGEADLASLAGGAVEGDTDVRGGDPDRAESASSSASAPSDAGGSEPAATVDDERDPAAPGATAAGSGTETVTDTEEPEVGTGAGAEPGAATRGTDPDRTGPSGEVDGVDGSTSTGDPDGQDPGSVRTAAEDEAGTGSGGVDGGGDGEIGDFDPEEFELDEQERAEIESEYGTEFQSGTEVPEPGEADIETPEPAEVADADTVESGPGSGETAPTAEPAEPDRAAGTDDQGQTESDPDHAETAAGGESGAETDTEPGDADLEDAVLAVTDELDAGGGADRSAVVETVADRHGADPDAVEDAIQEALMGGRCYEPDDGTLKSI